MINGIPKISVMVITYKQEKIVGRTLDSLIAQRDYLYEICVSDDCSPDGTWDVLLDYHKHYPDLIKLHRQNPNVGIFENTEYSWTMPTGDIINEIAGDDITPDGWYKTVIDFIKEKGIDWTNELFCIYGDFKAVYPNGDSIVFKNKAVGKYPNEVLRLVLRGIISGRGCCYSRKVLNKYEKVSQGRSHIVEFIQDRQMQIHSRKNYYIPSLANVYFAEIGVSAHIDEETYKVRRQIRPFSERYLENKGYSINKSDKYYGMFENSAIDFSYRHFLTDLLKMIYYALLSISIKYSFLGGNFRHVIFAIARRFPHEKPLEW